MKIYTRTGDSGSTGLFAGPRVRKNDARIEAFGTVDELNSVLGVVLAHGVDQDIADQLLQIQDDLFRIGARLATTDAEKLTLNMVNQDDVQRLETWIDAHEQDLPELKNFILPGGCVAAATVQQARTVSRRSERRVVSLYDMHNDEDYVAIVVFLNRLSDFFFVVGRAINLRAGISEPVWVGQN